ncbi:MAG: hypothetical protein LBD23_10830 [Oscillospiraceae bacterium]|nr:hypothetical protein [Oscillospiraceae bacterium]
MSEFDNDSDHNNEQGGFSLESILAEIKGTAFINGDKKTPPDLLQEKADRILREAAEMTAPAKKQVTELSVTPHETDTDESASEFIMTQPMTQPDTHPNTEPDFSDTDEIPMIVTPLDDEAPKKRTDTTFSSFGTAMDMAVLKPKIVIQPNLESDSLQNTQGEVSKSKVVLFDQFRTDTDQQDSFDDQATKVHNLAGSGEGKSTNEDKPALRSKWGFGKQKNNEAPQKEMLQGGIIGQDTQYDQASDDFYDEPKLKDAARRFAADCNSISIRVIPASFITLLMVLITYVFEAGMIVPFGIGYSLDHAAGTLMILLLIVMMLCSDVIVRGVDFLIRGVPNAETLILFSCVFSLISPTFTMLSGAAAMLPFCAVSALSLTFAAHGEKYNLRAITDTLKTAVGSLEPFGLQAEYNVEIDKSVLKKAYNRTDGFYNNLMQPDITEITYSRAAPVLLTAALLLTVFVVLIRGGVENSLHILSALLAAAAPFSALLSFSVPFTTVAKSTRKSGAAVAGWGGADDICFTDGVCITDDDLFPPGMLRLSGVKVYGGASQENAIRYTASLILSSGSGLTSLFTEVLKQQSLSTMNVSNFECHESGIGALIHGDHVSTGSAAFMNLLGVRVPDDANMKNAVYTAVNNKLVAMFAIDYKPLPSVQSALISMLKWRIDLYFAMRDFNVTPAMVGQKFKVPFDSFVFIPAKDSYSISDLYSGKAGRMAAVLIREGLNPYAEAITGGRLLKFASLFATILSIASAALGVLIMFYMCWTGSFLSASPGNLVIFMLCMLATVLIVCGYVRLKK